MKTNEKKNTRYPEFIRKLLVSLKRKPHMIALLTFVIAFLVYSLNLTSISNTTSKIQGNGMGLCGFSTMLLSMLSMLCFNNAFPRRKPVNKPMLILMFIMVAIVFFADITYQNAILAAVTRAENPIKLTENVSYIMKAYSMLDTHKLILIIGVVLTVLLPVYSKWIKKIKTSISVEANENMGNIDISGDD